MNVEEIFQQVMNENCPNPLHRFAELVAAAEREACARLCDALDPKWNFSGEKVCAAAIRARGDKNG